MYLPLSGSPSSCPTGVASCHSQSSGGDGSLGWVGAANDRSNALKDGGTGHCCGRRADRVGVDSYAWSVEGSVIGRQSCQDRLPSEIDD